jgi:hypothetical protein
MTVFGAGSLATMPAADAKGTKTVTYRVKGLSGVTCAVGLDRMLQKQRGILWSQSSYPDGIIRIKFDPEEMPKKSLNAFT